MRQNAWPFLICRGLLGSV